MEPAIKLQKDEEIAKIYLNRPQTFNAFDLGMIESFAQILISLSMDNSVSGIKAFVEKRKPNFRGK